jgi:hypothetical protein
MMALGGKGDAYPICLLFKRYLMGIFFASSYKLAKQLRFLIYTPLVLHLVYAAQLNRFG